MDVEARVASNKSRVASVEQPAPEPAQEHLHTIAEADEEHDVDAAPQQPGKEAAELELTDVRHGSRFANHGH